MNAVILCILLAVLTSSWLLFRTTGIHKWAGDNFILRAAKLSIYTPSPLRFWISFISEGFPLRSKFSVDDIPDLSNQVMIVTGGNRGVGFEIVKALLDHNARVYMAARSSEAATAAIAQLKEITGREALFIKIDLSDPRSVKVAAEEFLSKEVKLHVLFNNGGIMVPPLAQVSKDGYDYSWATNVMGPYLLTTLLLPALLSGATSAGDGKARVVNASSVMHHLRAIDFDALVDGPVRHRLGETELYCQSKNAIIVFSKELARRYGDHGIVSTAVNPGNLNTDLLRHLDSIDKIFLKLVTYPARYGALTPLYAGTAAGSARFNGKYFIPWAHEGAPRLDTQGDTLGQKLWSWLDEHTQAIPTKQ